MEFYITEFNYLNRTSFKVEDLFCSICNEVFKIKIYTALSEDYNICEECFESEDPNQQAGMVVNPFLKKQLSFAQFPCRTEQCNFKGVFADFHKHVETCTFGSQIICPMDEKLFSSTTAFIEHLSVHGYMTKLSLDSLQFATELDTEYRNNKIIVADYEKNYFIVFITHLDDAVSLQVVKLFSGYDSSFKTFTTMHQYKKSVIHQKGNIIPLSKLQSSDDNSNCLLLQKSLLSTVSEVTIYFADYEIVKAELNECPICMNYLTGEIKLCSNNHAICVECASKLNTCPICRKKMTNSKVSLNHVLPNFDLPCKNFDAGCLAFQKMRERTKHMEVCRYRKVFCDDCGKHFALHFSTAHFIEVHQAVKNFSMHTLSFNNQNLVADDTYETYILYRSNVFRIYVEYSEEGFNLSFRVKILNVDAELASKYCYEVIMFKNDAVIMRVSNICKYKSLINIEDLHRLFLDDNGKTVNIKCQFNILYNY